MFVKLSIFNIVVKYWATCYLYLYFNFKKYHLCILYTFEIILDKMNHWGTLLIMFLTFVQITPCYVIDDDLYRYNLYCDNIT